MKSESEVAQSGPTLHDPMDCSLPGSSVYGIFQARVLEWGAIAFSASCHKGRIMEDVVRGWQGQARKEDFTLRTTGRYCMFSKQGNDMLPFPS